MTNPEASTRERGDRSLRNDVRAALTTGSDDGRDLDVAVVGGGPAGLYTAYRLLADESTPYGSGDVDVFELSDRIGGRLDSITPPGLEDAGELGGMRFKPSTHRILHALATDVFADDLQVADFPMGDPANHLRYLRGQRFRADAWQRAQDAGDVFETRYFLDEEHEGFSPGQLFRKVIYDVLTADPWFRRAYGDRVEKESAYEHHVDLDRRAWDDVKRNLTYDFDGPYEGLSLSEMGMWAVLEDQLGHEGYDFLTDAEGYYALTANWNAAQAMADIALDFATEPDFETLDGGFDSVAYALANAVLDAGSTIWTENPLRTFEETPEGDRRYALTVEDTRDGEEWTVHADHVVLAMPREGLEELDQYNFFFDDRSLQRGIDSVFAQPALKILMAFGEPWWKQEFGAEAGASITDLPIRQCYYFGTNEADDRSLFLASYDDERAVSFWTDVADETSRRERRPDDPSADENANELRATDAPDRLIAEALEQVEELHGVDVPEPYAAYYKNWGADPHGGGYNHWKPDVDIADAMQFMRQPDPDQDIAIVGSAYSDRQGWVEGAFCTVERALDEQFGLSRPPWLDDDYYLGY